MTNRFLFCDAQGLPFRSSACSQRVAHSAKFRCTTPATHQRENLRTSASQPPDWMRLRTALENWRGSGDTRLIGNENTHTQVVSPRDEQLALLTVALMVIYVYICTYIMEHYMMEQHHVTASQCQLRSNTDCKSRSPAIEHIEQATGEMGGNYQDNPHPKVVLKVVSTDHFSALI